MIFSLNYIYKLYTKQDHNNVLRNFYYICMRSSRISIIPLSNKVWLVLFCKTSVSFLSSTLLSPTFNLIFLILSPPSWSKWVKMISGHWMCSCLFCSWASFLMSAAISARLVCIRDKGNQSSCVSEAKLLGLRNCWSPLNILSTYWSRKMPK